MPFFFQFTRSVALMSDQKNAEANKIVYLTWIYTDELEWVTANGFRVYRDIVILISLRKFFKIR